ncbi:MAG: RidA family protein [Planctomycetes bacterium]|nr:RidA family protein [Planctomycetota bacterium]MCH9726477.1 RidA family protein [Planctomycetota bacterium]MCH9778286.1 RidA family protein [Planctomycetota bacterium]MDF1743656.1 RidA family protein [Gimesia sp.]
MSQTPEERIQELGHSLPTPPQAVGSYIPVTQFGNIIVTSGQLPFIGSELMFKGKIGDHLHEDDGSNAATICLMNALAQIKTISGDLSNIKQIVRLEGYVHSAPGFDRQPYVLNAASQLLTDIFGEKGQHTRVALGISEMPLNAAVQIALWVELSS